MSNEHPKALAAREAAEHNRAIRTVERAKIANNNRIHLKSSQGFPPKQFLELAFSIFQ